MPPQSISVPGPQNMSPMGMPTQRHAIGQQQQQQMRQQMSGNPGFEAGISSQSGQMPPANYLPQGQSAPMIGGPSQQQFTSYQQLVLP
jgi:hypothetical protein